MSKNDKDNLQKEEDEIIKKQEEEKKKEEEIKEENKNEKEKNEIKEEKKTFWKKGIVESSIKTFEKFKFDKDDFDIVKNEEEEEEVKTVDQIFYRFVQDEIKDIDNFLKEKMEEWNNRAKFEKTYENFKNVFASNYERKNLFVPEKKDLAKN